jgi:hypothetical protein
MRPCLLVVDSDLGFAFWLGKVLDSAGYQTFPARDVSAAFVLLREIAGLESNLRMIIANDTQPDTERLIAHCRRQSSIVHVVWLRDRDPAATGPPSTAWAKPAGEAMDECKELLVAIGQLLASA